MIELSASQNTYPEPDRLSFPIDEVKNEWLPMLLDSYYIADKGVYEGIRRKLNQGRDLACAKGCSACCSAHTTIPIYPLEIIGIYWFAIEKLPKVTQSKLVSHLRRNSNEKGCPFLMEQSCSIHTMRPLACRHFNVFDTVCAEGEDAFYTRREDVLTPLKQFQNDALSTMLPFHGIKKRSKKKEAMKSGYIHTQAQVLQDIDWSNLAKRMNPGQFPL